MALSYHGGRVQETIHQLRRKRRQLLNGCPTYKIILIGGRAKQLNCAYNQVDLWMSSQHNYSKFSSWSERVQTVEKTQHYDTEADVGFWELVLPLTTYLESPPSPLQKRPIQTLWRMKHQQMTIERHSACPLHQIPGDSGADLGPLWDGVPATPSYNPRYQQARVSQ